MRFADTHCHLDFSEFDADREAIIQCCQSFSIDLLVVPSVRRSAWETVLSLSKIHRNVYAGLGLHPYFIADHHPGDLEELARLLENHSKMGAIDLDSLNKQSGYKMLAVGELGLDAKVEGLEKQRFYFHEQLKLAEKFQLPVILHSRKTHNEVIKAVRSYDLVGGVLHAFSGSSELSFEFIRAGLKLGVGGVITWPKADKTRKTIAQAPLESLVLETDAPDMPVFLSESRDDSLGGGLKLKRKSTPLHVLDVFDALCEIRHEPPDIIAAQLWQNAQALFFAHRMVC